MYKRKAIKKHFFAIARKYMLMAGDSVYRPIVQFCLKIYISFCIFIHGMKLGLKYYLDL